MTYPPGAAHVLAAPATNFPTLADFYPLTWWLVLLKVVALFAIGVVLTLFMINWERKVVGRMQQRPGPNRVGPGGWLQSLADGLKLAFKEDIMPVMADKRVYFIAPVISTIPAFVIEMRNGSSGGSCRLARS